MKLSELIKSLNVIEERNNDFEISRITFDGIGFEIVPSFSYPRYIFRKKGELQVIECNKM